MNAEQRWSTIVPLLLVLLGVLFSPFLYDLLQWLPDLIGAK